MKPILYESTRTQFNDNGIGILSDAVSCFVTEERNGKFELVLNYPVDGIHYREIKQRSIIAAKAHADGNIQPFRVYRITKPLNGMVSIYAEHISYDLSGIAVSPFTAGSAAAALQGIKTNSVVKNPFEFWTDKSTTAEMAVKTPASARAVLGGVAGSVLDTYGGEYEWDGYTVKLHNERGQNRGVSIRYGKNLVSLEQEENCAAVYTSVLPFWADSNGNVTMLTEKTVKAQGTFDFERVLTLDLSNEFDAQPTQEELRNRAQKYIADNNIGVPKISLTVSFVPLEQTEEYKDKAFLEKVLLCDTVNVVFEKLGVSATAKVVKTVFDVLLNRYKTVELGDTQSNLADTLIKQDQAIKEAPKKAMSMAAQAAENATQLITGNRGGYVVIHSSTGQSQPDEILIMDKPTIEEAVKVWRWNNSGLGYSETGYSGTYTTAWTIDGAFNADFITAGTISANLIKSGLLQSLNGMTSFDMDSGKISIVKSGMHLELTEEGIEFFHILDGEKLSLAKMRGIEDTENFLRVVEGFLEITRIEAAKITASERMATKDLSIDGGSVNINESDCTIQKGDVHVLNSNGTLNARLHYYDGYGGQVLVYGETGKIYGVMLCNGHGELRLLTSGEQEKMRLIGGENSAEIRVGGGDVSWRMIWNDGKSHVQADEFKFLGKTDGLVTSKKATTECSAYIVYGQPTKGGYVSSTIIPSDIATGNSWQIADETNYIVFTVDSYGNATKNTSKSSSGSGNIIGVYSIR